MEIIENNRKKIDEIDEEIIRLLNERMKLSKEIGKIKQKNNISIEDKEREKELIKKLFQKKEDLSEDFIEETYSIILKYSKKQQ